jgi:EAL domain-containing protein (putative c-di-GMP-specific phosphodiesterase class I)
MARSLGMQTTAEGIETQLQFNKLLSLGIELGQGFLFSRALPADELPALFLKAAVPNADRKVVAADFRRQSA